MAEVQQYLDLYFCAFEDIELPQCLTRAATCIMATPVVMAIWHRYLHIEMHLHMHVPSIDASKKDIVHPRLLINFLRIPIPCKNSPVGLFLRNSTGELKDRAR